MNCHMIPNEMFEVSTLDLTLVCKFISKLILKFISLTIIHIERKYYRKNEKFQ